MATDQSSESNTQPAGMLYAIANNAGRLGIFALLCTLFIASTHWLTKNDIAEQQRKAQLKALLEIVPANTHDNDLLNDFIVTQATQLGLREESKIFLAKQDNQASILIYPSIARDGYSGDIAYIVGIDVNNDSIAGVRVLKHKETPGLGDGIDVRKSDWILSFNHKSLNNPKPKAWTVKKDGGDFDAFTGATITPRAVVKSVANTLRYHSENKQTLLSQF